MCLACTITLNSSGIWGCINQHYDKFPKSTFSTKNTSEVNIWALHLVVRIVVLLVCDLLPSTPWCRQGSKVRSHQGSGYRSEPCQGSSDETHEGLASLSVAIPRLKALSNIMCKQMPSAFNWGNTGSATKTADCGSGALKKSCRLWRKSPKSKALVPGYFKAWAICIPPTVAIVFPATIPWSSGSSRRRRQWMRRTFASTAAFA